MPTQLPPVPYPGPDLPPPRHLIVPQGITTDGYEPVRAVLAALRLSLDPWQHLMGRYANALTDDGTYAAQVVMASVGRQAGKTLGVFRTMVLPDCIIHPNTLVVWTSHHGTVSTETARSVLNECSETKYARYIAPSGIRRAIGREEIVFRNGSRILFRSRERGGIRGVAKVRKLILDEAQRINPDAMADLIPTTNAAWNPQIVLVGTPPGPDDRGETFTTMRARALAGEDPATFYLEYSADPELPFDCDEARLQANPAYACGRMPSTIFPRMRAGLAEDQYAREALGQWTAADSGDVISEASWLAAQDPDSIATDDLTLGIAVSANADSAAIVVSGRRPDGRFHIALHDHRPGVSWILPFVQETLINNPEVRGVIVDAGSSSRVLLDDLAKARIKVTTPRVADIGMACLRIVDGINSGTVLHNGQPQMNLARAGARKRPLGDTGMWAWSRKSSVTDITPIEAATLALWGVQTNEKVLRPTSSAGRHRSRKGSMFVSC